MLPRTAVIVSALQVLPIRSLAYLSRITPLKLVAVHHGVISMPSFKNLIAWKSSCLSKTLGGSRNILKIERLGLEHTLPNFHMLSISFVQLPLALKPRSPRLKIASENFFYNQVAVFETVQNLLSLTRAMQIYRR